MLGSSVFPYNRESGPTEFPLIRPESEGTHPIRGNRKGPHAIEHVFNTFWENTHAVELDDGSGFEMITYDEDDWGEEELNHF